MPFSIAAYYAFVHAFGSTGAAAFSALAASAAFLSYNFFLLSIIS